jgi:hypothetical protein
MHVGFELCNVFLCSEDSVMEGCENFSERN